MMTRGQGGRGGVLIWEVNMVLTARTLTGTPKVAAVLGQRRDLKSYPYT